MPVAVTALDVITRAMKTAQVLGKGETPDGDDESDGLTLLNDMLDEWGARRLTIYTTPRSLYPLTGGKGAPNTPYTIGPGGDFNQAWPEWISEAGLVLGSVNPNYELPLDVLTNEEYAHVGVKTLAASLASALWYDRQFGTHGVGSGLGNVYLYPVPDGSQSLSLALYIPQALAQFADLAATTYTFPPGYVSALHYQLAKRIAAHYETELSPESQLLAVDTFALIQRANIRIPNLRCDPALTGNGRSGYYNWRTGSTGRN